MMDNAPRCRRCQGRHCFATSLPNSLEGGQDHQPAVDQHHQHWGGPGHEQSFF